MDRTKEKSDREGFASLHRRFRKAAIELDRYRVLAQTYLSVTEPPNTDSPKRPFLKKSDRFFGFGQSLKKRRKRTEEEDDGKNNTQFKKQFYIKLGG